MPWVTILFSPGALYLRAQLWHHQFGFRCQDFLYSKFVGEKQHSPYQVHIHTCYTLVVVGVIPGTHPHLLHTSRGWCHTRYTSTCYTLVVLVSYQVHVHLLHTSRGWRHTRYTSTCYTLVMVGVIPGTCPLVTH